MLTNLLWLAAIGPLCLTANGFFPKSATRLAEGAALIALAGAAVTAASVAIFGTLRSSLLGIEGIGFSLYVDRLSALMLCLVAFIGVIVVTYSRTYMQGDPGHGRFTARLCVTLSAVLLLILAGNVAQFTLAWFATSVGLNRLLLFYRNGRRR